MGKRAAGSPKAKAAKAPRASTEPQDPFASKCAPLLEFLASTEAGGLSAECREMLIAAAPLALARATDARHGYQTQIIESIATLVEEAEKMRRDGVEAAQAKVAALDAEESTSAAELESALSTAGKKQEVKEAKAKELELAQEEEAKKKEELNQQIEKEKSLSEQQKVICAEKEEFEKLVPEWDQLEEANYHGREWQQRNKTIVQVMKALAKLDLPVSLTEALPVAFKLKKDARGKFALVTLQHGKAALTGHIESLGARVDGFSSEVEQQASAVAAAREALQAAGEATAKAFQNSVDAENDWVTEASKVNEVKEHLASFKPRKTDANVEMARAASLLERAAELTVAFRSLVEPPAPAPAPEAVVVASEEAPPDEAAAP